MDLLKKFIGFVWDTVKIILISIIIIVPIRYYLVQPFFVKGASMVPNFQDGEYLIIDELSYRFKDPQRGEVIVFRYPLDPSQFFIKRIVGLPGERIKIENGDIIIYNKGNPDGFVLDEDNYLLGDISTSGNEDIILGDDEYFVLGDNRGSSSDSRMWGSLDKDLIVGRTWLRVWPVERARAFHR